MVEREAAGDSAILVNLYRLGARKGVLGKGHYAKYADAALDVSSPGEAAAAVVAAAFAVRYAAPIPSL
mgnify:CR=1 FL=1